MNERQARLKGLQRFTILMASSAQYIEEKLAGLPLIVLVALLEQKLAQEDPTFTVKLVSAQADFSSRLGYSAYSPLPSSMTCCIEYTTSETRSSGKARVVFG